MEVCLFRSWLVPDVSMRYHRIPSISVDPENGARTGVWVDSTDATLASCTVLRALMMVGKTIASRRPTMTTSRPVTDRRFALAQARSLSTISSAPWPPEWFSLLQSAGLQQSRFRPIGQLAIYAHCQLPKIHEDGFFTQQYQFQLTAPVSSTINR